MALVRQIPKESRFIAWFPFQQCYYVMFLIRFEIDCVTFANHHLLLECLKTKDYLFCCCDFGGESTLTNWAYSTTLT
jgi:hypothetical protein